MMIPEPIYDKDPSFSQLYRKAWELAHDHIKEIPGMPQTPYMDEAFCETEIWIWDSCFMALFCKYAQSCFPGVESLNNFYKVLYDNAELPFIIPQVAPEWTGAVNGKPSRIHIHISDNPPLFAWAEYANALFHGDCEQVRTLLLKKQYLQKHFFFLESLTRELKLPGVRTGTRLKKHLNGFFWEGGHSGMDNTPRGRIGKHAEKMRPNNPNMLWLDALAQQGVSALYISRLAELIHEDFLAEEWRERHRAICRKLNQYYWDDQNHFYFDIHAGTGDFMRIWTIASYWPLFAEAATAEQASFLYQHLLDPLKFGGIVPCVSLARDDADFNAENGLYWRGALWIPTAYMTIKALEKYGMYEEAHRLSVAILKHMSVTFQTYTPHTIWEAYSPSHPAPARSCDENNRIVRPDFCGWSALAPISMFIENVIGIHTVDAFHRKIHWQLPRGRSGRLGVRNLRFGDITTSLIFCDSICEVTSTAPYVLEVNGVDFDIHLGTTLIPLFI